MKDNAEAVRRESRGPKLSLTTQSPNAISLARLMASPILFWLAYAGNEGTFKWLLLASLLSDITDGIIARRFNLVTVLGAKLDSIADQFTSTGAVAVAATILANRMKSLGSFSYAAAAALASARLKAAPLDVAYDRERPRQKRLTGLIISNTRHLANFVAFPDADCTDGRLDVMEMYAGPVTQNARNLSALVGVDLCTATPIHQVRAAKLSFATPALIVIDCEILEDISVLAVQILPKPRRCRCTQNI